MTENKPSLIVRMPNWVGDVVMALPTIYALRDAGIELQLIGKPWMQSLLSETKFQMTGLKKSFWETRSAISQLVPNKTLLLTNSLSSALLSCLAGKKTIGYKTDHRQLLLVNGLAENHAIHEVEYFWNIATCAIQTWFPSIDWPAQAAAKIQLPIAEKDLLRVKQLLVNENINQDFWLLCPFALGTSKENKSKVWPLWPEFAQQLENKQLVVCPGIKEEQLCAELVPNARVLAGLNLGEYAALLSLAQQVIANDSGPMHIAAAVNQNTLGIFGVTDPNRTHPWGGDYIGSRDTWPSVKEVLQKLSD